MHRMPSYLCAGYKCFFVSAVTHHAPHAYSCTQIAAAEENISHQKTLATINMAVAASILLADVIRQVCALFFKLMLHSLRACNKDSGCFTALWCVESLAICLVTHLF